jgi:uncharacterized protein (TIGR02246 family)
MQSEADAVRALNARFYQALCTQNLLEMEEIWAHGPNARCVHLGSSLIRGWDAIRTSWRLFFSRAICLSVEPQDAQVAVLGLAAVVNCVEHITMFTHQGSLDLRAQATNVFEKHQGRWHLMLHHASAIAPEPAHPEGAD